MSAQGSRMVDRDNASNAAPVSGASPRRSLRTKLVRLMAVSITVVSIATLAAVAVMNIRISRDHLAVVERQLTASIEAKGKVLTENQALALKSMVADNAFGDVDLLVRRVVDEDRDVVYGLFLSLDGKPWAYYAPDRLAPHADTAAANDALGADLGGWKNLGVTLPADAVAGVAITSRTRFGQDIIEFTMPVRDGADVLGAIYYGLSTRTMQQARDAARAHARGALIQTLAIMCALAVGTALLFLVLAMRQAERITRPLGQLTAAAAAIACGRRDACVRISSGDELELLGGAFNQMVRDLDASYSQLEDMNKHLEQRVEQRTLELASRNRDMRLVLDNVEQGFITVDMNGVMALERSAVVDKWLGASGAGSLFVDLIAGHDGAFSAGFGLGLESMREDSMPLEVSLAQLPSKLTVGARELRFSYSPVFDRGKLSSLLVVAADVTERIARERNEREQLEAMAVFERIMSDRRGFLSFFADADQLVGAITADPGNADLSTCKRLVHTLKGNAATFGLSRIAELCHDIEDSIEELAGPPAPGLRDALARRWQTLAEQVRRTGDDHSLVVSNADHDRVVSELAAAGIAPAMVRKIAVWRLEHVQTAFTRLGDNARAMAAGLGKSGLEVSVDGGDLMLDPRHWDRFWSELVHVIRNSVDHGIETPELREASGKSPCGRLAFEAHVADGAFVVSVTDDGGGIDWSAVAAKARACGLPADRPQDLERALFASGFSTRDEITMTSGRGVGLDAVQQAVTSLDGRVEIDSALGRGTTFRFVFPEDAMAGAFNRELDARLSSVDDSAANRRRRESTSTRSRCHAPGDPR
jgi:two-component system chemotaxis sensor kinase CheA